MKSNAPARSQLLLALKSLKTPHSKESVWIGPFDQLVSSAYALLKADILDFENQSRDDYYNKVFSKIVMLMSEFADEIKPSDPEALDNYLSRIYFNAGFQRLTWAAERLITTFGAVKCTCGCLATITKTKKGRWPQFSSSRKDAKDRLGHCHSNSQLSFFREMLTQFEGWNKLNCDPTKSLSILYDQVNPKKHSVYDCRQVEASRPQTSKGVGWTPPDQMSLVADAFELVCKAYCELRDWNPKASL